MVQGGDHEEDTPATSLRPSFLLSLKSFAARNSVFAPGAQTEDEVSEAEAESDSEISDKGEVNPVHDTTAEDPAEDEESGEEKTDVKPPTQETGLCLTAREWKIRVLTSEFRKKQLEAHHPAQTLINHPPELEFSQLVEVKKALEQVKSLPTDQRSNALQQAEKRVFDADWALALAEAKLDAREAELILERSNREIEEMKEYEGHLRAAGTKRKANTLEESSDASSGLQD